MDTLPPTPEALLVEPLLTCTAPPTPLAPIPSPPATVNKPAVPELLLPELTVTTPDTPLLAELSSTCRTCRNFDIATCANYTAANGQRDCPTSTSTG
ncbi:hypothetical protein PC119_g28577 [Phytophthora cactorum]|nr:hypothetical protein PC119_g28577 [Phytophthora cactorum]